MVEKHFLKLTSTLKCPADMTVINTASSMLPQLTMFVFIA